MARRKRPAEHENHERWLVSYADFITLLFAFFVVMFASSQGDKSKAKEVSEGVKEALQNENLSAMVAMVMGKPPKVEKIEKAKEVAPVPEPIPIEEQRRQAQLQELMPSLQVLSSQLSKETQDGEIQIHMTDRGLVISFAQTALFPSGDDAISPKAFESIGKVAEAIIKLPNRVRLEGHTDARPIKTPRFHSNWDLSALRAVALLQILTERFDVPTSQLSVAGYADSAPVASNATDEGRGRNRRVDIIVLNEQGMKGEPMKMDAAQAATIAAPATAAKPTPAAPAPASR
jgi:chemotaxis protein MotB